MSDMIRRDVLLAELEKEYRWFVEHDEVVLANGYCLAMLKAKNVPGVDAVPVVHARWEASEFPEEKYRCSACGGACWYYDYQGAVARSRYCPNCGAKMDGGAEDADPGSL